MSYLLKPRSKLLFVSGLWTMLYSLMLRPTPDEVEGMQAILVVMVVWPGFLMVQPLLHGMFKKNQNKKVHASLVLLKVAFFLIQMPIVVYEWHDSVFWGSVLAIFLIDFQIMKLENKVTLKEVDLSEMARQKIVEQFATGWFLMGSVVLLFSLYFQLGEGNYTVIIYQALFYLFSVLRKHELKVKYISIQLVGLLIVYFLTTLNGPELLKGILLITVLTIIYRQTKLIYNQQKSLTTLNHKKVAFSSNEKT
ncbi:MAG: hypothetical protein GX972_06635 [Amphibacillus sp.]|nr:hypothetical protein [Amphibacillus sp.]